MAELTKELIRKYNENEPVRLNKFLSDAGFCSRREADRLIGEGKVEVDGAVATLGQKVMPGQKVTACGKVVEPKWEMILLAFNKPAGVECTTVADVPGNIIEFIGYPERIYPIGRLDKNSTGLILLTNTGDLVNSILKSVNEHEKEYEVQVEKPVTDEFVNKMSGGVLLKDVPIRTREAGRYRETRDIKTRPCQVKKTGEKEFDIILTQGINRQIRRMCEELGYTVTALHRTRIMNIELGDLPEGKYREVTEDEVMQLISMISG